MAGLSWISLFGQQPKQPWVECLWLSHRYQWRRGHVGSCIAAFGSLVVLGGERAQRKGDRFVLRKSNMTSAFYRVSLLYSPESACPCP